MGKYIHLKWIERMKCGMRTFENLTNVYTKRSKVSMCVCVCICASTQNDIVQSNSTHTHSVFNLIPLWMEAEWKQFCNFALRLDQFGTVLPLETLNNVRSKWWTLNSGFIAAKDGTFTKTRIGHNCFHVSIARSVSNKCSENFTSITL